MRGNIFNHWRHFASKRFLVGAAALPIFYQTARCESPVPEVNLDAILKGRLEKETERLQKAEKIAAEAIKRAIKKLSEKAVRDSFQPLIDKAIQEGTLKISQEINREILGLRSHIRREVEAHAAGLVPKAIDHFLHQHEKVDQIMKRHTSELERAIDKEAREILNRIIQEDKYREINTALIRDLELKTEQNNFNHLVKCVGVSSLVSGVVAFLIAKATSGSETAI